jgi:hypothetical protein
MPGANVKQQIHELVDKLPDDVTWRDAVYEMVTRREIELGLADSDANRITSAEDVLKEYGFDQ